MKRRRFLHGLGITMIIFVLLVLIGPFLVPVPPMTNTVPRNNWLIRIADLFK